MAEQGENMNDDSVVEADAVVDTDTEVTTAEEAQSQVGVPDRPQAQGQPRAVQAQAAPARRPGGRYVPRRKVCAFCVDNVRYIDYKDVPRLRRYLSERAKIEPRRKTGTCARHQRALSVAIKRARHMALLPFVGPHSR